MRYLLKSVMGAAGFVLAMGGATAADVRTTVDPKADFSKHQTFAFFDAEPKGKGAITDKAARERLRHLIAQHLNKRGYRPVAPGQAADLGVNFTGHVEPKQSVLMTGRPGPYSYSWGRSELGGQDTFDYREGTLIVDLVDLSGNRLLWRTRIQQALTAGYSEENWKKVDRALGEAFKKLPQSR